MAEIDHFELLGLPLSYSIDANLLEANYLARSREAHPDYHQDGTTLDRQTSLRSASRLNEAYRTLKDPYRRAEYLLALRGGPTAAEAREMPKAFLTETLELRMQAEELKAEQDEAGLRKMESELERRRSLLLGEIGKEFETANGPEPLKAIRQRLNALKFIQGLLRDIQIIE